MEENDGILEAIYEYIKGMYNDKYIEDMVVINGVLSQIGFIIEKFHDDEDNDKSKKYILRGQRNARYHEKILSNKKESYNLT